MLHHQQYFLIGILHMVALLGLLWMNWWYMEKNNVRIRHYWDKVRYQEFGALNNKGYPDLLRYNGINENGDALFDRNVNIFNVDLQYNWRFAPGSDFIFVWKNQIFNNDKEYQRDYFSNLGGLFDSLQTNSFSVRVLFFLDYLQVFPRKEV